jgi:excisionase family DNA binding protein
MESKDDEEELLQRLIAKVEGLQRAARASQWLTVAEVAERTRLSRASLYRHMADPVDPLPSHRRGRRRLFSAQEVDDWVRRARRSDKPDIQAIVTAIEST